MCIISVKPQGLSMPTEQTITTMFNANSHGAGYMIQRKGEGDIKISKGYSKIAGLLSAIRNEKVTDEDVFILHFRIATSGGIKHAMCHPFVAHKTADIANAVEYTVTTASNLIAFAHNGVIQDLNGISKDYSDTSIFAQEVLSCPSISENVYESVAIQRMVEKFIDGSRLALLHPTKGLLMLGEWVEDEGLWYSNKSYETKTYEYYGWGQWEGNHHSKANNKVRTASQLSQSTSKLSSVEKQAADIDKLALQYDGMTLGEIVDAKTAEKTANVPAEIWSTDMVIGELRRVYQTVMLENPSKGMSKKEMIQTLDEYREDCINLTQKVEAVEEEQQADQTCQCDMCFENMPVSEARDLKWGLLQYKTCKNCVDFCHAQYETEHYDDLEGITIDSDPSDSTPF